MAVPGDPRNSHLIPVEAFPTNDAEGRGGLREQRSPGWRPSVAIALVARPPCAPVAGLATRRTLRYACMTHIPCANCSSRSVSTNRQARSQRSYGSSRQTQVAGSTRPPLISAGPHATKTTGSWVRSDEPSYLIAMRGKFTAPRPRRPYVPGGHSHDAVPETVSYSVQVLVVSIATGCITDSGGGNEYPDLDSVGQVVTDRRSSTEVGHRRCSLAVAGRDQPGTVAQPPIGCRRLDVSRNSNETAFPLINVIVPAEWANRTGARTTCGKCSIPVPAR